VRLTLPSIGATFVDARTGARVVITAVETVGTTYRITPQGGEPFEIPRAVWHSYWRREQRLPCHCGGFVFRRRAQSTEGLPNVDAAGVELTMGVTVTSWLECIACGAHFLRTDRAGCESEMAPCPPDAAAARMGQRWVTKEMVEELMRTMRDAGAPAPSPAPAPRVNLSDLAARRDEG
jgi:hypothetical protein